MTNIHFDVIKYLSWSVFLFSKAYFSFFVCLPTCHIERKENSCFFRFFWYWYYRWFESEEAANNLCCSRHWNVISLQWARYYYPTPLSSTGSITDRPGRFCFLFPFPLSFFLFTRGNVPSKVVSAFTACRCRSLPLSRSLSGASSLTALGF